MQFLAGRGRQVHRSAPPRWTGTRVGVRVLVEHPDPLVRARLERGLKERGYEVLSCAGPRPDHDGAVSCPLLHQEHCPAVDGADVVVNGLRLQDATTRIGLRRARTQHPVLPIIVAAPSQAVEGLDTDLADAHLHPLTVDRLAELIDELVPT